MNKSLTFCLAFLLAVSLPAQLNKATLTGVVLDPSGAAIAGARITARQLATNAMFSTTSTATGNYAIPALDASALETESTRVSTNLTRKLVEDLPLVVSGQIRNVFNLALIAPETKTGANGQFRIGGGQTASWEMTMDGVSLTSASTNYQYERAPISSAPVDAIQEFAVESTGMTAEYGRSMGTVSFTTKSGTNQVHGNAFEFLRNNATDAGDQQIGSKNHLSFLFLKGEKDDDFSLGQPPGLPNLFNGNSVWSQKNTSYRLSWDRTLSMRIVNSLASASSGSMA